MAEQDRFPDDLPREPLSHQEATRGLLSWENTRSVDIVDITWIAGERY